MPSLTSDPAAYSLENKKKGISLEGNCAQKTSFSARMISVKQVGHGLLRVKLADGSTESASTGSLAFSVFSSGQGGETDVAAVPAQPTSSRSPSSRSRACGRASPTSSSPRRRTSRARTA